MGVRIIKKNTAIVVERLLAAEQSFPRPKNTGLNPAIGKELKRPRKRRESDRERLI